MAGNPLGRPLGAAAGVLLALAIAPAAWAGGQVMLDSDPPGASVTMDGASVGSTPWAAGDVPAGRHRFVVRAPHHRPRAFTLTILNDLTTHHRVHLPPVDGARPSAPTGDALVLSDPPGAALSVDGVPIGATPVHLTHVRAGAHRLVLRRPGQAPVVRELQVVSDLTTTSRTDLHAAAEAQRRADQQARKEAAAREARRAERLAHEREAEKEAERAHARRLAARREAEQAAAAARLAEHRRDLTRARRLAEDHEAALARRRQAALEAARPAQAAMRKEQAAAPPAVRPNRVPPVATPAPQVADAARPAPRSVAPPAPAPRVAVPATPMVDPQTVRSLAFDGLMAAFLAGLGVLGWRRVKNRPAPTWQPDRPRADFRPPAEDLPPGAVQATLAGLRAVEAGRPELATGPLEAAHRLAPGPDTLYNLALAWDLGRSPMAEVAYRALADLAPGDRDGRWNLAVHLAEGGRPAEALVAYRELVAADPRDGAAWFNLGNLLTAMGRSPEAVAAFKRAKRWLPGDPAPAEQLRVIKPSVLVSWLGQRPPLPPYRAMANPLRG